MLESTSGRVRVLLPCDLSQYAYLPTYRFSLKHSILLLVYTQKQGGIYVSGDGTEYAESRKDSLIFGRSGSINSLISPKLSKLPPLPLHHLNKGNSLFLQQSCPSPK